MERISPEEVRAEVARFWNVFSSKSKDEFEEIYFPTATVFSSTAEHTEPGRLMVTRRLRQFFDPAISLRVEIGSIGVQLVGTNVAIATYIYRFRSTKIERDGTQVNRETPFGRATQIFQRDEKWRSADYSRAHEFFDAPDCRKNSSRVKLFGSRST